MINNLSIKLTGLPVNKLRNKNIPKNALTFKLVKGYSAKRGDFTIISLFDNLGNLIEICSKYVKKGYQTKITNRYSQDKMIINSVYENNGEVKFKKRKVIKPNLFFTEEINFPGRNFSIHRLGALKKHCMPKVISYLTFFDGRKPIINYLNVDKRLKSDKGLELLPLVASTLKERCIEHLSKYRIREEKLEGIASPAQPISLEELTKKSKAIKEFLEINGSISAITDQISGEVYVVRKNETPADLIDTIAHEYQHVKDFSDILRLEDKPTLARTHFEMLSMNQDPIEKSDPKYKVLWQLVKENESYRQSCNEGNHDNMLIEQRAIQKGKEQTNLFNELVVSIKELLS